MGSCIMDRVSWIVYRVSWIVYRVSCIVYRVSGVVGAGAGRGAFFTLYPVPCTLLGVRC